MLRILAVAWAFPVEKMPADGGVIRQKLRLSPLEAFLRAFPFSTLVRNDPDERKTPMSNEALDRRYAFATETKIKEVFNGSRKSGVSRPMPLPCNDGAIRRVAGRSESCFQLLNGSQSVDLLACPSRVPDASGPRGSNRHIRPSDG